MAVLVNGAAASAAWAQGAVPAPAPEDTGWVVPVVLAALFIGLLIAAVWVMDLRRRRRDEAAAIEASLSDALLREPRLAGTVITAHARLPMGGGPPVVEVRGEVSYPEYRDVAIRAVRQELLRYHQDARVEDRIFVAPPIEVRSA
jgi:hypothetical protein